MSDTKAVRWEVLPACEGEYHVGLCGVGFTVTVSAQSWSNKEQRRLPIDSSTKWGAWCRGKLVGLNFDSAEDARIAALEATRDELYAQIEKRRDMLMNCYDVQPPVDGQIHIDEAHAPKERDHRTPHSAVCENSRSCIQCQSVIEPMYGVCFSCHKAALEAMREVTK